MSETDGPDSSIERHPDGARKRWSTPRVIVADFRATGVPKTVTGNPEGLYLHSGTILS
jgi:hypothetical protein